MASIKVQTSMLVGGISQQADELNVAGAIIEGISRHEQKMDSCSSSFMQYSVICTGKRVLRTCK
jgi:hypothetical protein